MAHEAPVSRADVERALRALHASDVDARDLVMRLAAQVVALTEELDGRLPELAASVGERVPAVLERLQGREVSSNGRVLLESEHLDKYEVSSPPIPCAELLPLCGARCCQMTFALSTQDLDEGVVRWDYGRPYRIRQRASDGFCVHNDPSTHGCTVHAQRPATCRRYDCRTDRRVWLDFENRIPAPRGHHDDSPEPPFDLVERIRRQAIADVLEDHASRGGYADEDARVGPVVTPRKPQP